MKAFKTRTLAVLTTLCMLFSLLPISALAADEDGYSLTFEVGGTGVVWYAKDEAGAEISDGSYAVPTTEITVDTDGETPTVTLTTELYVKAAPGYAFNELESLDIEAEGDSSEEKDPASTFDMTITDEGLEYCDLKVSLKFDGYAVKGNSTSIALTIDADPVYELSFEVDGTGVVWYAKDEAGAEISDGSYAVPTTEITVDTDGETPTVTLTTELYVKAAPGFTFAESGSLNINAQGDSSEEKDPANTFAMTVTDEGLEYCDLKVTLKFDGYAVKGKSTSIALRIDADPTYLTLTAGGKAVDISGSSAASYADAKAILLAVDYNAKGVTVPVAANVEDSKDGVMVGYPVVDGVPAYDEEAHTGVNAFVDVTPENTVENPVYVAVRYIPNKEGATEAKPYDEFFKLALYMTPAEAISFSDVSDDAYYAEPVAWAVENGVTNGMGDGTFGSNLGCTRAQFVTFLYRAAGSPEVGSVQNKFSDVSATAHANYYDAILWAVEQGITSGTGDGSTFSPDVIVTRAQAVTFMHRYAQKAGIATETGAVDFDDVANEGAMAPYYDAIGWAVANSITNGNSTTANTFGPMDDCVRANMITFLYRLFSLADDA